MDERIQLLARLLEDDGLEYAFGVTGSGPSLALITELEGLGVRYFPVAHEASAALMAGVVSRLTGRVSISISIKGPGLSNMLPGIASNHFESNPALSISEAFGTDVPSYRKHKRLDHASLLSSLVKSLVNLNDLVTELPLALRLARSEVPGPIHLDLCRTDVDRSLNSDSEVGPIPSRSMETREKVLRQVGDSRRPILIAGSLATRRDWSERLSLLNIPVFTTAAAKGIVEEKLAHSAGVFTGDGKELAPESHLFEMADLVLGIGLRNAEVLTPRPFGKPTVVIDEVDGGLEDGFNPASSVAGADDQYVVKVIDALDGKCWGLEEIGSLKARMRSALLDATWLPAACFEVLNGLAEPHTLVLDTGSFSTVGEHVWQAGPNRPFLGASNGRSMGVAIPTATGAAICRRDMPVYCVVGDGGVRDYLAEVKVAVQENLPICFILMSDGLYGSIASTPGASAMSHGAVNVAQPSWYKAIDAMGCEARKVNSEESFIDAVQAWNPERPLFLEATFDPQSYGTMTRRLR